MDLDEVLAGTFSLITPHLTERQRRLLFGAAARALGYGGVSRVARLVEASRPTVRRGAAELDQPADPWGRIRQHEGPKRRRDTDPGLLPALDRLVDPDTRGDPDSPLRGRLCDTSSTASGTTAFNRRRRPPPTASSLSGDPNTPAARARRRVTNRRSGAHRLQTRCPRISKCS